MRILLWFFISVAFAYDSTSWLPPIFDETCSFTREDARKAIEFYVDVNPNDNQITKQEIIDGIDKYLKWWMRPVLLKYNADSVLEDCDYDKNGVITPRDFKLAENTCFPNKASWCTIQWFNDNIKSGKLG